MTHPLKGIPPQIRSIQNQLYAHDNAKKICLYMKISVVHPDLELDIHKESYDIVIDIVEFGRAAPEQRERKNLPL